MRKYTISAVSLAIRAAIVSGLSVSAVLAGPPVIELAQLNGQNGFRLDGISNFDAAGRAVGSAGDVNGDGVDDLVVGAVFADSDSANAVGHTYVVFGRRDSATPSVALSSLDGSNGFRLVGEAQYDYSGRAVSGIGDINGDGLDDLLVGADGAGPNIGKSYVVFGRSVGFAAELSVTSLNGTNGFVLEGGPGDQAGMSVSGGGDFNADGMDDLIVGGAEANSIAGSRTGSTYVVYGRVAGFAPILPLQSLDGNNGFRLDGEAVDDFSGSSVSALGDMNGDGVDDLAIGAPRALNRAGRSYVVFGQSSGFAASLPLSSLDGSNGFKLDGETDYDISGASVSSAGDINGDGLDDLVIGARYADPNGLNGAGTSYVVFGRDSGFGQTLLLSALDGSTGFKLNGEAASDYLGVSVSSAGDTNGDGLDDLIIGARGSDPNGVMLAGRAYLLYGRPSFSATVGLSDLDGINGSKLNGQDARDDAGRAVGAAGDLNGDGIKDVVVGASGALGPGRAYVVMGARDRMFVDSAEDENIEVYFPRLSLRQGLVGSGVRWQTGATCNCFLQPFDFNPFLTGGQANTQLAFSWPNRSVEPTGGVLIDGNFAVLQPGDVIGPGNLFSQVTGAVATATWRAGVDGYLGFRFVNTNTGLVTYGYARLRTTAPSGYPATLLSIGYNLTGKEVIIPLE